MPVQQHRAAYPLISQVALSFAVYIHGNVDGFCVPAFASNVIACATLLDVALQEDGLVLLALEEGGRKSTSSISRMGHGIQSIMGRCVSFTAARPARALERNGDGAA